MPYVIQPLACNPIALERHSEKLVVSHYSLDAFVPDSHRAQVFLEKP
jgi:hypothetical protein